MFLIGFGFFSILFRGSQRPYMKAQSCISQWRLSKVYSKHMWDSRYIFRIFIFHYIHLGLWNLLESLSVNLTSPPRATISMINVTDSRVLHHQSTPILVHIRNNEIVCGNRRRTPAKFHYQIPFGPKSNRKGITYEVHSNFNIMTKLIFCQLFCSGYQF